jgi:hypothetical protein
MSSALAAAASLLPDADLWLSTRLEKRFGHTALLPLHIQKRKPEPRREESS